MQTKIHDDYNDIKGLTLLSHNVLNILHACINSFNSHNNPMVYVLLLLPLYR